MPSEGSVILWLFERGGDGEGGSFWGKGVVDYPAIIGEAQKSG